jgi:hypothetical protein
MDTSIHGIGGTKTQEYVRSLELFKEIFKNQGSYFALAFLYDLGYDRQDISNLMEIAKDEHRWTSCLTNVSAIDLG